MSESNVPIMNVRDAFDPTFMQGQADFEAYLASRPYATYDNPHDHTSRDYTDFRTPDGESIHPETYFMKIHNDIFDEPSLNEAYELHEQREAAQAPFRAMKVSELAQHMAEADHQNDVLLSNFFGDLIQEKIEARVDKANANESDVIKAKQANRMLNKAMGIYDARKAELADTTVITPANNEPAAVKAPKKDKQKNAANKAAKKAAKAALASTPTIDEPTTSEPATSDEAKKDPETLPEEMRFNVGIAEKPLHGEDRIVVDKENDLYAVIDGMGGQGNGDVAAQSIKESFEAYWRDLEVEVTLENAAELMEASFNYAQNQISDLFYKDATGSERMGAVATAIKYFLDAEGNVRYVYGSIGDTRLYSQDGQNAEVKLITTDEGEGNVVNNCFGPAFVMDINQVGISEPVQEQTRVMLCSDGITGDWDHQIIEDEKMKAAFDLGTTKEVADKLVEISLKSDDKSVIVIELAAAADDDTNGDKTLKPATPVVTPPVAPTTPPVKAAATVAAPSVTPTGVTVAAPYASVSLPAAPVKAAAAPKTVTVTAQSTNPVVKSAPAKAAAPTGPGARRIKVSKREKIAAKLSNTRKFLGATAMRIRYADFGMEKKPSKKSVAVAAGLLTLAAAGVTTYLVTRGHSAPSHNRGGNFIGSTPTTAPSSAAPSPSVPNLSGFFPKGGAAQATPSTSR